MKKAVLIFLLYFISIAANAQRNVILIIADDLGTDYFGFYEDYQDTVDVPNIRALMNRGIRFKNAASNPVCSSTRAGILTGRYSFRTGVGNIVGGTGGSGSLDTAELTIPRLLNIYNPNIGRANIGKWHLHGVMPASNLLFPNVLGFELYEGPFIGQLPSYTNWIKYTNGVSDTVTNYATSENVDDALTWLNTQNGKPFFLWLAFNAPHAPLHLPPAGLHNYVNLSGAQFDINQHPKEYFKADLQALDHEIGRLFDSLTAMNRLDSTDIIFIGDNGNTARTAQITDTSRAKGTVYQYGIHVPFIAAGPSVVNPGRSSDALVNTADIFSTVLELFGDTGWQSQIPALKPVDSRSILPIITNQSTQVRQWSFSEIFKNTHDSLEAKAIRNQDYKLIKFDYGQEEFYNLTNDSNESVNLLNGSLTAADISNYNYLCTELTNLIGSGNYCSSSVSVKNIENTIGAISAYPNPFSSYIYVMNKNMEEQFVLLNNLGELIYSGKDIEKQDFSYLSKGIYFLKSSDINKSIIKLTKE